MTTLSNAGGESQNQPVVESKDGAAETAGAVNEAAGAADWTATLPPELKNAPAVKKFKGKDWNDVGPQILKSYISLEKWQVPGEGATPEEKASFARRLGVPEKVEEYKIEPVVPEGVAWSDHVTARIAKFGHAEGIPPATMNKIVNFYLQMAKEGVDVSASDTARDIAEAQEKLKREWGGDYQRNVGLVQRAVEEYGSPQFNELLDETVIKTADGQDVKLGNHPVMLAFLKAYGEQRLEGGFIPGDALLASRDDTLAQIDKIKNDPKHPYWNDNDAGHKAAVEEMRKLFQRAYPDTKRA